jgi:hypothetical protein
LKFIEEQIVGILQGSATGQKTQAQFCKDHGVNLNMCYIWKRKYAGPQTDALKQLRELELQTFVVT